MDSSLEPGIPVTHTDHSVTEHGELELTNVAPITNFSKPALQQAQSQMPPAEKRQWDFYLAGNYLLPVINWDLNVEPPPTSPKSLKDARRRAEALNRLYGTGRAQPAHAVWFTKHALVWLPLVKAVARVIGAERDIALKATRPPILCGCGKSFKDNVAMNQHRVSSPRHGGVGSRGSAAGLSHVPFRRSGPRSAYSELIEAQIQGVGHGAMQDQNWGLCDKDCGWCGHCMDSYNID